MTLVDTRPEKAFSTGGLGRLTLMADVINVSNSDAVTHFSLRTGADERVIAVVDPIALKQGTGLQL